MAHSKEIKRSRGRADYEKLIPQLEGLRARYRRGPYGYVSHHGDCDIWRAEEMHGFACCTCGLIHDLVGIPDEMMDHLYSKYVDDRVKGDICWEPDPDTHRYRRPLREEIDENEVERMLKRVGWQVVYFEVDEQAAKEVLAQVWPDKEGK